MILGIDHVELCVFDVKQSIDLYSAILHVQPGDHSNLQSDEPVITVNAGSWRLRLRSGHRDDPASCHFVHRHGSGVSSIGFLVDDVTTSYGQALQAGATSIQPPHWVERDGKKHIEACIGIIDDLVHPLLEASSQPQQPVGAAADQPPTPQRQSLSKHEIDHIAICLNPGQLDAMRTLYCQAFAMTSIHEQSIARDAEILMHSCVVASQDQRVRFVLIEPSAASTEGHLQTFLQHHRGPGVQHLALATSNIASSVKRMKSLGVRFLSSAERHEQATEPQPEDGSKTRDELKSLDIHIDREANGLLYQIFTHPLHERPTFFLELIQRDGAIGFGSANVKALFHTADHHTPIQADIKAS